MVKNRFWPFPQVVIRGHGFRIGATGMDNKQIATFCIGEVYLLAKTIGCFANWPNHIVGGNSRVFNFTYVLNAVYGAIECRTD